MSGFRKRTYRALQVISPRLFACENPWLRDHTTRASGNSEATSSAVPSRESLSTTTTSALMSPRWAKTVLRHGLSHCASLVETVMIARSCTRYRSGRELRSGPPMVTIGSSTPVVSAGGGAGCSTRSSHASRQYA